MKKWIIFVILVLIAAGFGCSKRENKPVARIGDHVLTIGDLEKTYLSISRSARPKLETPEEKQRFLRDVVNKEILRMEAEKRGLDKTPEAIQAYQSAMRSAAWQAYYQDKIRAQARVTEKYLNDLYERQKHDIRISWILLRSKPLADEVASRIANGEDFETLARLYSLDPSRDFGGDYGARPLGIMPDQVQQKIYSMNVGEISGPIPYDDFWVFIRIDSKEAVELAGFEEVRKGLESLAQMSLENSIQRKVAAKLRQSYALTVNDDVIDLFVRKLQHLRGSGTYDPSALPEFSDEERDRVIARFKGGEWKLGTFVDKLAGQAGASIFPERFDVETVKSIVTDLVTAEIWSLALSSEGYEKREDVRKAAEKAREEVAVTMLHDEIVKNVTVSEDTLKDFYERNKEQFKTELALQLGIIIVDTEEEARQVFNELRAGKDFSILADERSKERVSAERGGMLPRQLTLRELEPYPDVYQLVTNLKKGQYTEPIRVPPGFAPEGYMILKLIERSEPRILTYDEMKQMLRTRITVLEQDRVFGEWLGKLIEEYKVELYPQVLDEIDFSKLQEKKT